jgi:hypothetical protein
MIPPPPPRWIWGLPIIGILLALFFRPSEINLRTFTPAEPPPGHFKLLYLPNGEALRFLKVPEKDGSPDLYLSLREVPTSIWKQTYSSPPSLATANAFARHLAEETGESIRLPTLEEWRRAAQSGVPQVETPWGFGRTPPAHLRFAREKEPGSAGPPLGFGFQDLAGGRWEWVAEGLLVGSAWSERDPQTLRLDSPWKPPEAYAGWDTAVRLLWESTH